MTTMRARIAASEGSEFTALSERMTQLLGAPPRDRRVVVAWAAVRPELLGIPFRRWSSISVVYRRRVIGGEWLRRAIGPRGFMVLSAMLLVDGVFLAFAMYATGAAQSPLRFLVFLHLVGVSLLCSYRTGLKIALWHSLLLFVVLYAQAARLVPPVDVIPARASSSSGCRCSTSRASGCSRLPPARSPR